MTLSIQGTNAETRPNPVRSPYAAFGVPFVAAMKEMVPAK
jgi:hypothetical protein